VIPDRLDVTSGSSAMPGQPGERKALRET